MSDELIWRGRAVRVVGDRVELSREGDAGDFDFQACEGVTEPGAFAVSCGTVPERIRSVRPLGADTLFIETEGGKYALFWRDGWVMEKL